MKTQLWSPMHIVRQTKNPNKNTFFSRWHLPCFPGEANPRAGPQTGSNPMSTWDHFLLPVLRQEAKGKKSQQHEAKQLRVKGCNEVLVLKRTITSVTAVVERFKIICIPFLFCLIHIEREAFLRPLALPTRVAKLKLRSHRGSEKGPPRATAFQGGPEGGQVRWRGDTLHLFLCFPVYFQAQQSINNLP